MKALKFLIAGGVAAAALMSAAPAAAQYYPGYGGGNVIGQVLNQVLGGGYGAYGNPYGGYGGYSGYGGYNNGYAQGGARVLGVTSVERRSSNGLRVRGGVPRLDEGSRDLCGSVRCDHGSAVSRATRRSRLRV